MLVAAGSLKASPGVTTFALALAARWTAHERCVLVECDPAGGDVAARFGLPLAPGLISLAAAGRRGGDPNLVWQHTQALPGGLAVVVGPPRADQARAALRTLTVDGQGGPLAAAAGQPGVAVIADCGRLDTDSAALPLVRAADRLLVLVRPHADELAHLASRLEEIGGWAARIGLLLAGTGYPAAEVARELGVPVLATVPGDRMSAAVLSGRASRRHGPARSALARAAALIGPLITETGADTPPPETNTTVASAGALAPNSTAP